MTQLIVYDAKTVFGGMMAEAINNLTVARQGLERVFAAAQVATNNGGDTSVIEAGNAAPASAYFGVHTGDGNNFYQALSTILSLLATADASNLAQITSSLDAGG